MFLVLLIGLGVGAALGESTSSNDDSEDTPSKLTEGYLGLHPLEVAWRNHDWEKSRSAGRDMSYSSSFGSEDFDSPDIPSDFHAKWGINKTWYVKTPHPILSRRESFENYGRAPAIDSTEIDSSEISSSSKEGTASTRPEVAVTKSTTSTTKIATTLKIQHTSTLKSFISTVLPTKLQITTIESMAVPPLPKSPSESKQTNAKLEISKNKVTPKAVTKLEEAQTSPVNSPTAFPQKNPSPRQPPITHAGSTVSPIFQTKLPITITAVTAKLVVIPPTGTTAAGEVIKSTPRSSVAARADIETPTMTVAVASTASVKQEPTAMQPTTRQQIVQTTREQHKIVVMEKPQQTPKAPITLQNHPSTLKPVTHPSGNPSVEKPPSAVQSDAHRQSLLPSTFKPSPVTLNFFPSGRTVLPSTLKAILVTSQSNSIPLTTIRVMSVTKPETNHETSHDQNPSSSSEKPIVVTTAPQQTPKTNPTITPASVLNTLLPTSDKSVLITHQPAVPITTTPEVVSATKPNAGTVVPATKSIILTTIKAITNPPPVVPFTTVTTLSITVPDKTEPNLPTQPPATERITTATIQSATLPTTSKGIFLTTIAQIAEIPTTAAVVQTTLSPISHDITKHFVIVTHSHKSHAHTHTHPTHAHVPTRAHTPPPATKKPTMRPYDQILDKAGDLIRPKTTLKPTIKSNDHPITRDTTAPGMPQEHHSTTTEQHKPSPPSHVDKSTTHKPIQEFIPIHETEITTSNFGIHTTEEGQVHHTMTTPVVTRFKTRAWGPPLPKMDKSKRRRNDVIVLKPPPEDWPEPKAPEGAKVPPPPMFGATIPPMGTYIDTRIGRKGRGFSASSYHSPPYMGHRKIDFAPQYDRKVVSSDAQPPQPFTDNEAFVTSIPTMKWRIRGRRDRQGQPGFRHHRGGGYLNEIAQEPGFMRDLTMKPSVSKFFISDNASYLSPTVRNARPFQRNYFNFRMRPPGNVGRSFGPPEPPFPPPPPPRFAPNHPFGQPPFPQFPQPYPPFPHGPPPPHFGQGPPPLYGQGPPRPPPPPYGQGPPPPPPPPYGQVPPPPFRQGPPHFRPPPQYGPYEPHSPLPPGVYAPPGMPQPRGSPDSGFPGPPPSPPPPYPGGPELPPVRPFLDNIPTISPIDNIPAPWPRRQIQTEFKSTGFAPQPRVPDFLRNEPRNFSGYKGPRRGRAYEQYGKADLRPRHIKFFDEFSVRGTPPRFPARKGSGFGVEFQDDITRPSYMPDDFFGKRTWAPRVNKFGYEPYRRANDRRRPYGFGKYAAERPPVLGEFGQFNKPYRRMDDTNYVSFNYSRPTRSYTFPPRLRLAIRNASFYRRNFRHSGFRGYTLPTLPSIGLEAHMAQDHDYHGNIIQKKGRITNLQDLKYLFTLAPETEGEVATEDGEVATAVTEEQKVLKPRITAKPKGMTAREAMRAAAREAMRETEMEDWEQGAGGGGRRRGWRRIGGSGGRRGQVIGRGGGPGRGGMNRGGMGRGGMGRGGMGRGGMGRGGMGRGGMGRGGGQRNFRRAKRSIEESEWLEKQERLSRSLGSVGDYLTGPGASSGSTERVTHSQHDDVQPLRMRRWRVKGRPRAPG